MKGQSVCLWSMTGKKWFWWLKAQDLNIKNRFKLQIEYNAKFIVGPIFFIYFFVKKEGV